MESLTAAEAIAPAVWPLETGNALLVAERRGRLSEADSARFLSLLEQLPIAVERETPARMLGEIIASKVKLLQKKAPGAQWHVVVQMKDGSVLDLPTDGEHPRVLLPPPADPAWSGYLWSLSPDGRWLAYKAFVNWRKAR